MRLIDADAIEYHMMAKEDWLGNTTEDSKMVWKADIDSMPTVDAIPVAFIESEKQRVQGMIEESVKMGMIAESERLSLVMVILDHVVSNWYYNTGPEWRGEPNDTNRF